MADPDMLPTAEPLITETLYRDLLIHDGSAFPFRCVLDLTPLAEFWRHMATKKWGAYFAGEINRKLDESPELLREIDDPGVLEPHIELVKAMMTAAFPPATWEHQLRGAIAPFQLRSFFATPTFSKLLLDDAGELSGQFNLDVLSMEFSKTLQAYLHILTVEYGITLPLEYPMITTIRDAETGLDRHFRLNFDTRFVELKKIGNPRRLTEEQIVQLRANLTDLTLWSQLLPPENYEFHGFTIVDAVEVSDQEVLSALKRDLIENESILSSIGFIRLQDRLRTMLRCTDLELGIAAIEGDEVLVLNHSRMAESGCFYSDAKHYDVDQMAGSIFDRCAREQKILVIEDLEKYPERSWVEEDILAKGVRSLIVAPLQYKGQVIGMLNLWSMQPGGLNALSVIPLAEILPLFSVSVHRSTEALNSRVQRVIREQYTAIHPSVEWRFRKAALTHIQRLDRGEESEIEPIVFTDVYPLYSLSDVRGSSVERNTAIQADLIEHLQLAGDILRQGHEVRPLPFLDNLLFRIERSIAMIESGLSSGDEAGVIEFIRREIEPVFDHLQQLDSELRTRIEQYHASIDPHLGSIYHKRRDFEESVAAINRAISMYIDDEQVRAQAMFPHYFEKHKSDGVDMGMYAGPALLENGGWNVLYLRNLRLWQLMTLCGVARLAERLKPQLKVPLDTTHLILVQQSPLAIRFHQDEKQFDVDGAYNIRYEIMKKRIDKAVIRGTTERLTQPGMIAIVYSQSREAMEYREYIDYLRASGYLMGEVEDVELEDLQGVFGLRALRVAVRMESQEGSHEVDAEGIERAIRAIVASEE